VGTDRALVEESVFKRCPRFVLALALTGCITGRYTEGNPIAWRAVESLQPGETTKTEVLARCGAPLNFSSPIALAEFLESQGLEAPADSRYPFSDVFAYQMNYGKLRGFTVILYTRLQISIVSDLVVVFFDERGIVSHVGVRRADRMLE
jgi:hypothetical protein